MTRINEIRSSATNENYREISEMWKCPFSPPEGYALNRIDNCAEIAWAVSSSSKIKNKFDKRAW